MNFAFRDLFRHGRTPADAGNLQRARSKKLVERGIAAETAGDPGKARDYFRQSVEADGSFADAHMNLGIALHATGDPASAIASFERAVALDPSLAAAHFNLARTHLLTSSAATAEEEFRTAVRLREDFAEAWVGLAGALEALGRDDEAIGALDRAITIRPDFPGALLNSITLLRKLGRLEAAADNSRRLLDIEPENALAHTSLGIHAHAQHRLAEAEERFRTALVFDPEHVPAKTGLAVVLLAVGRARDELHVLLDAVASDRENGPLRRYVAKTLDGVALDVTGEREREVLLRMCRDDTVSMLNLNPSITAYVRNSEGFRQLQAQARSGAPTLPATPAVAALWREPILLAALPRMPIVDPEIEAVLKYVRRGLLDGCEGAVAAETLAPDVPVEFVCALARHCHFTGYVYFAHPGELEGVARLREVLDIALDDTGVDPATLEAPLAVFALYESLLSLPRAERLQAHALDSFSDAFRPIVIEQSVNPLREREIARDLVSITPIADEVSRVVRAQYEENPYPRWATAQFSEPETIESLAARLRPGKDMRVRPRPVTMLVAGCGTGHLSVQYAQYQPDAQILAVDLSRASLAYAIRMTEHFGLSNIQYRQADILELGRLTQQFALIDCSGVLHHLEDPMAGWRVLVDLLEPDGLMKICLYSEKARRAIQSAREYVRTLGLPSTPEGLRACRQAIAELPDGHLARKVTGYGDFYTLDSFRDLIMHVQEHQFTLPRIEACLRELGLTFLGMQCPPEARPRFMEMFPEAGAEADLATWDRFEEVFPDTFIGMYAFWCCRQ